MSAFLAKFYELIIYVFLAIIVILLISLGWQKYHRTVAENKVLNAEITCQGKIDEAVQPYLDAEKRGREIAKEVSEEYEQRESKEKVRIEKITVEVPKIIERTVYLNSCFDDDGMQLVNDLRYTSES